MATPTVEDNKNITPNIAEEVVNQALLTDTSPELSLDADEPVGNAAAEQKAAIQDSDDFGTVNAAEREIETDPEIAEEARENTPVKIHSDVANAGITAVQPNHEIPPEHQAAEAVSTVGLTGEPIKFPQKSTNDVFPPVSKTGVLANPDLNGEPLHMLWLRKVARLIHGVPAQEQRAAEELKEVA